MSNPSLSDLINFTVSGHCNITFISLYILILQLSSTFMGLYIFLTIQSVKFLQILSWFFVFMPCKCRNLITWIKSHDIAILCLKAGPYLHKNYEVLHHALFSIFFYIISLKTKYLFVNLFADNLYWCSYHWVRVHVLHPYKEYICGFCVGGWKLIYVIDQETIWWNIVAES